MSITTIYVTHDQVEAMTLGDRIAVMSDGRLQQIGAPQEVYDHPANLFVAGFIGSPPMNLLRATGLGGRVTAGDLVLDIPGMPDGELVIGLRPETLKPGGDGLPSAEFEVDVVEPLGDEVVVHGTVSGQAVSVAVGEEDLPPLAESGSRAAVTARFDPHTHPSPGERIRLGVPPEAVHVFDARTGATLR